MLDHHRHGVSLACLYGPLLLLVRYSSAPFKKNYKKNLASGWNPSDKIFWIHTFAYLAYCHLFHPRSLYSLYPYVLKHFDYFGYHTNHTICAMAKNDMHNQHIATSSHTKFHQAGFELSQDPCFSNILTRP